MSSVTAVIVGFLMEGRHMLCKGCFDEIPKHEDVHGLPYYDTNIDGYSQRCHRCNETIHEGKEGWPDLMPCKGCLTCHPDKPCSMCQRGHRKDRTPVCLDALICPCSCGDDAKATALEERGLFA